jgi:hypothetical protein
MGGMKMTGTSNVRSISLTASSPELPSANWISARIRPGRFALARATASLRVRATARRALPVDEATSPAAPEQTSGSLHAPKCNIA